MFMKAHMAFPKPGLVSNHFRVACLLLTVSLDGSHAIVMCCCIVEPGYYEDGAFGVRIENVELIKETETKYGGTAKSLTMEPLTLVSDCM